MSVNGCKCSKVSTEFQEDYQKMQAREALYASLGYDSVADRKAVLEACGCVSGEVLEAGTGKGYFSLELARKHHRFVTIDVSEETLRIARRYLEFYELASFATFKVENAESLSFPDQSFGAVFSVKTLHHLENPWRVLDEFIRVLNSGGKLVLSDFSSKGFELMDQVHAREGTVHDAGKIRVSDVEAWLEKKGYPCRMERAVFQETLIAVKPS